MAVMYQVGVWAGQCHWAGSLRRVFPTTYGMETATAMCLPVKNEEAQTQDADRNDNDKDKDKDNERHSDADRERRKAKMTIPRAIIACCRVTC